MCAPRLCIGLFTHSSTIQAVPVMFLTLDQPKYLCLTCVGVPAGHGRQGNELRRHKIENIFKFDLVKLDQTSDSLLQHI